MCFILFVCFGNCTECEAIKRSFENSQLYEMPRQSQCWSCAGAGYTNLPAQHSLLCSSTSDKYKGSVFIGNSRSAVERQEHPGLPRRAKGLRWLPSKWNQNRISKAVQELPGRQKQGGRHVPNEGKKHAQRHQSETASHTQGTLGNLALLQ